SAPESKAKSDDLAILRMKPCFSTIMIVKV
ncbi:unnamed protein product, partial [marine sediment metagenome]